MAPALISKTADVAKASPAWPACWDAIVGWGHPNIAIQSRDSATPRPSLQAIAMRMIDVSPGNKKAALRGFQVVPRRGLEPKCNNVQHGPVLFYKSLICIYFKSDVVRCRSVASEFLCG